MTLIFSLFTSATLQNYSRHIQTHKPFFQTVSEPEPSDRNPPNHLHCNPPFSPVTAASAYLAQTLKPSGRRRTPRTGHQEMIGPSSSIGLAIVLMGVSGSGKSTIGGMLAKLLNARFLDADDYHPQSNKDKMKIGTPLSDEDRIPWLQTLRDALRVCLANGEIVILGCSALQKYYREILRSADPHYISGTYASDTIKVVLLSVTPEVLGARLKKRADEGNHFMPATLLQSQLDLLHIDESEGILKLDASLDPQETLRSLRSLLEPVLP